MRLETSLRKLFCGMLVMLPFIQACGDSGSVTKPAPEPNVGPASIPGGGPADATTTPKKTT